MDCFIKTGMFNKMNNDRLSLLPVHIEQPQQCTCLRVGVALCMVVCIYVCCINVIQPRNIGLSPSCFKCGCWELTA